MVWLFGLLLVIICLFAWIQMFKDVELLSILPVAIKKIPQPKFEGFYIDDDLKLNIRSLN